MWNQNVKIDEGAVSLSGSAREGSTLRARFDDDKDVNLDGSASPALVLYTWYRVDDKGTTATDDDTEAVIKVTTSNEYRPVQADVGHKIKVSVSYYEVFEGRVTKTDGSQHKDSEGLTGGTSATDGLETAGLGATLGGVAVTSRNVAGTPDDGRATFTILAESNTLKASAYITDGDYSPQTVDTLGTTVDTTTYRWQVSDNGRGGWTNVAETDPNADTDVNEAYQDGNLSLDDGDGKYYRVIVSYNEKDGDTSDNPPQEEIASQVIRVGNVSDPSEAGDDPANDNPVPTVVGSPNPGGTLMVEGRGVSSVQWQKRVGAVNETEYNWANLATGASLSVTQAHAEAVVRAVVTYEGDDGVTSVVFADANAGTAGTQEEITIGGAASDARPVALVQKAYGIDSSYDIEVNVTGATGTGHAEWRDDNTSDRTGLPSR